MSLRIYGIDRVWYSETSAMGKRCIYDCDTLDELPAAAAVGEKCYCAETNLTYQWDGDSWEGLGGGGGITETDALEAVYPVGSIYISVDATNPGTTFGVGTWAAFGAGRVLVGVNGFDADFDGAEETGGAKTHTLTVAEMPAHTHPQTSPTSPNGGSGDFAFDTNSSGASVDQNLTGSTGGGGAHSNLQPYICVFFWKRTE